MRARVLPGRPIAARERRRSAPQSLQAGFTLVEVLVVLSIMALLMSLIGPQVIGYLRDSKLKAASMQAEALSNAVELFYVDNNRYPLDREGLEALVKAPAALPGWNGPYLRGTSVPLDPWGNPYRYATHDRGRSFTVTFGGAGEQRAQLR